MRYSLLIHVLDDNQENCKIYVKNNDLEKWWIINSLHKISFNINDKNIFVLYNVSFPLLNIKECIEPDLSTGINIYIRSLIKISEDDIALPNIFIRHNDKSIGSVSKVSFEGVLADDKIKLELEIYESPSLKPIPTLPNWVNVIKKSI